MARFFLFLIFETKPNILFAIFIASHLPKNLGHQYIKDLKTIL